MNVIDLAGALNIGSNLNTVANPDVFIQPTIEFSGQLASPPQPDQTITVNGGSTLDLQGQIERRLGDR